MLPFQYKNAYHGAEITSSKVMLQTALVRVVKTGLDECGNLLPSKDVTRTLTRHCASAAL